MLILTIKYELNVTQAFEMCKATHVCNFNLSYESLTGEAAQERLQNLRSENPQFHAVLTQADPTGTDAQGDTKRPRKKKQAATTTQRSKHCGPIGRKAAARSDLDSPSDIDDNNHVDKVEARAESGEESASDEDPFAGEMVNNKDDDSGVPTWAVVEHVVHG